MDKTLHLLTTKQYKKGVTLITPSSDRHFCIARCEEYVRRQTYKGPLQWIVAEDSPDKYNLTCGQIHIHRKSSPDKVTSFLGNIKTLLPEIEYEYILIIEDDDWYSPEYIKLYKSRLDRYELVGEGPARYYNVQERRYRLCGNVSRASFCQTALRANQLPALYLSIQKQNAFVDARLWDKKCSKFVFQGDCHCVGIKGMPGKRGIGMGHRPLKRLSLFNSDPKMETLERWIGKADTDWYRSLKF
jgi:hypothetical protein